MAGATWERAGEDGHRPEPADTVQEHVGLPRLPRLRPSRRRAACRMDDYGLITIAANHRQRASRRRWATASYGRLHQWPGGRRLRVFEFSLANEEHVNRDLGGHGEPRPLTAHRDRDAIQRDRAFGLRSGQPPFCSKATTSRSTSRRVASPNCWLRPDWCGPNVRAGNPDMSDS